MSNIVQIEEGSNLPQPASDYNNEDQFLTFKVNGQIFGVSVLKVRDVLKPIKVTKVPLAKREILGFMNLRGRIVTVIDVRKRLNQPDADEEQKQMQIVVEFKDELFSLLVDEVGDAQTISYKKFEKNPVNLGSDWKSVSKGVFKNEESLMLILDIENLLKI